MTMPGMKLLLSIFRSHLPPGHWTKGANRVTTCLSLWHSTVAPDLSPLPGQENTSVVKNLTTLGVDVRKVRQHQPGVLRKAFTNEGGLTHFLHGKGASPEVVAGIISRFPRAITRSQKHLAERWELWRTVFESDEEVMTILNRSPESFFRSSDNENLGKNIGFLRSLGLHTKHLHRLLTTAPRTFSNSVELNRQRVSLLQELCVDLGGGEPEEFATDIITRNLNILLCSTKRVRTNVDLLRSSLKLSDAELLELLQGNRVKIIELSTDYLSRNLQVLRAKLLSLSCCEIDIKNLILNYTDVLYTSPALVAQKIDCLLNAGISTELILKTPKVLQFSVENLTRRLKELRKLQYDFEKNGINILDSSHKRFNSRLQKLSFTEQ